MGENKEMFGEEQIDGYEDGEEPIVFHHKNGEYRKYEEKKYSDLAIGKSLPKKGLFRALVSTRGNRLMLIALIACVAFVYIYSFCTGSANENVVSGVHCSVSAFSYEDIVYVSCSLKLPKKSKGIDKEKKLNIVFQVIDNDGDLYSEYTEQASFTGEEIFVRKSFPDYGIVLIKCEVSEASGESVILECPVSKR